MGDFSGWLSDVTNGQDLGDLIIRVVRFLAIFGGFIVIRRFSQAKVNEQVDRRRSSAQPTSPPVYASDAAPTADRYQHAPMEDATDLPATDTRFGSVFDEAPAQRQWGFDESEWGSTFDQKDDKPRIR